MGVALTCRGPPLAAAGTPVLGAGQPLTVQSSLPPGSGSRRPVGSKVGPGAQVRIRAEAERLWL